MSVYASRTPESIGCTCYWTDPSTWFHHYGAFEPGSQMEPNYECFEHFPHAQHNEPNPILVAFRSSPLTEAWVWLAAVEASESFGGYRFWNDEAHPLHVVVTATDEHLDHADRVLTRLLAVREAATS